MRVNVGKTEKKLPLVEYRNQANGQSTIGFVLLSVGIVPHLRRPSEWRQLCPAHRLAKSLIRTMYFDPSLFCDVVKFLSVLVLWGKNRGSRKVSTRESSDKNGRSQIGRPRVWLAERKGKYLLFSLLEKESQNRFWKRNLPFSRFWWTLCTCWTRREFLLKLYGNRTRTVDFKKSNETTHSLKVPFYRNLSSKTDSFGRLV